MKWPGIGPTCITALLITGAAAGEAPELKVSRVALFSSGVGFFECNATVEGDTAAELRFRTDQINDILKSLVVQDLDGGSVGVVRYASRDPIEKSLKSFGVDITGKPSLAQLLDQLRGEPIQIAGPRSITGIIIGVEKRRTIVDEKNFIEVDLVNILTDGGIQQLRVDELQGIKLLSDKVNEELRKALATLAAGHDADRKSVVLHFDGKGSRHVRASYLIEAPIWKTSYRLVLGNKQKPFLQGWAMVENATEEDWKDVRLSLISGRPISFVMDLYTPLYVPRPVEQLELYASLGAPELEAGSGGGGAGSRGGSQGIFSGGQGGVPEPKGPAAAPEAFHAQYARRGQLGAFAEEAMDLAGKGVASVATALEAGELFEYQIKTPVSLPRRHSAMLPIVNQEIEAEKISVFNAGTHPKYPLNALSLHNTTRLNLMQGPATVFDESVYAGDAKLPDLRPDEKRLAAYALDLAMEVTYDQQPHPEELVSLSISKGTLWHLHKYLEVKTYTVKNKDDKDRTILIEHPIRSDWTLVEPKEVYERTPDLIRIKIVVPKSGTASQRIRAEWISRQSLAMASCGMNEIRLYLSARVIAPDVKAALERVMSLRTELDALVRERESAERDLKTARDEQVRIRENVKVLQSNSDVHARQMKKFDDLETQIEQLSAKTGELHESELRKREALEAYLLSLETE